MMHLYGQYKAFVYKRRPSCFLCCVFRRVSLVARMRNLLCSNDLIRFVDGKGSANAANLDL